MALLSGVGPHRAWLNAGGQWPIEHGRVLLTAARVGASSFNVNIPMSLAGAEDALANVSGDATVTAQGVAATDLLITGEVDRTIFDYVGRTITVQGHDKGQALHHHKTFEKWQNKKGSEIVQDLAGRVGLGFSGDASKIMAGKKLAQDYVKLTDGVSFASAIHLLAQIDGARVFVDKHGTLNYQSLQSGGGGGGVSLHYRRPTSASPMAADFLELQVTANVQAMKGANHVVHAWHTKDKKLYTGKSSVSGGGGGAPLDYYWRGQQLTQDQAQQYAEARAKEQARHQVKISCKIVGDPTIDITDTVSLSGTGNWDQTYYIDEILHDFGYGGYTTSIAASSEKSGAEGSPTNEGFYW